MPDYLYGMSSAAKDTVVPFGSPQFEICKTCSARRFGVCGALKVPELAALARHTSQRKLERGAVFQYDSEETREYVNIVSGVVKLTKLLADGRQQIVGLQFSPEFVGRPFSDAVRINAEAASDLELCVFPRAAIETVLTEVPLFERRLLEQSLSQLDTAREWILTLGRKTASEKVASLLVLLLDHLGISIAEHPKAQMLDLVLSRSEIADYLGLTIETVSRELTKLSRSGAIEIDRRKPSQITVPERDRLVALSE